MTPMMIIVLVIAIIIAVGIISSRFHKSRDLTVSEVVTYIENFATGKGKSYDWDDFTSCPHNDPRIADIVRECEHVAITFPPRHNREWCNEDGLKELMRIAQRIRAEAQQPPP